MSASMASAMFSIAEVLAKRDLPEPTTVYFDYRRHDGKARVNLSVESADDQRVWARSLRFPAREVELTLFPSQDGRSHSRAMEAEWRGTVVMVYFTGPVPVGQCDDSGPHEPHRHVVAVDEALFCEGVPADQPAEVAA